MKLIRQLNALRDAGIVARYHTARILRPESVAEHSFNVVNIVLAITKGLASKELIVAALTHDMGEYLVGDIPAPVKLRLPPEVGQTIAEMEDDAIDDLHPDLYRGLTKDEERVLKIADRLDGLLKCLDELKMGNTTIIPIGGRYVGYLHQLTDKDDYLRMEVTGIIQAWNEELSK